MAQHGYDFGDFQVGIRSTSEALSEVLDDILAEYRSSEEMIPTLSIVFGGPERAGRSRRYHILYRRSSRITRTRNLAALADALFAELEGLGFPERDDAIYMNAGLMAVNGTVGLASTDLISFLADLGRVVERSRLTLPGQAYVAVDPGTGRIVPLPRTLHLPQDARDRIAALAPPNDEPPRLVVDQPRPVDIVFSEFEADDEDGQREPAARQGGSTAFTVAELAALVTNMPQMGLGALEGLANLVQQAKQFELRQDRARPMLEALASVLRAG